VAANGNALGDYLRARRGQVRPEDVGLVQGARRRVQGLRREELATLAGISSDYYLRLEQGRDKNPSAQVLDALARALLLDIKATEHLHQLAVASGSHRDHGYVETVTDGVDELIEQFAMPAIVASRCLDVLAANSIARALSPGFTPGENFLRWRLLEPAARDFYVDWDEATDVAVSGLREAAASDPTDPRLRSVIDELWRPVSDSANCGRARTWGTGWASCTCATRRWVTCTCNATGSTSRTLVGNIC
jgi:transcriptional regulator with XRE-family HTH domain